MSITELEILSRHSWNMEHKCLSILIYIHTLYLYLYLSHTYKLLQTITIIFVDSFSYIFYQSLSVVSIFLISNWLKLYYLKFIKFPWRTVYFCWLWKIIKLVKLFNIMRGSDPKAESYFIIITRSIERALKYFFTYFFSSTGSYAPGFQLSAYAEGCFLVHHAFMMPLIFSL